MCVFVSLQSFQSERSDGRPEAELRRTRFHRCHHQHPHAARQHAWREPPTIACPHTWHPTQHPGHRLHPGHSQNLLLITSDHACGFPLVKHPTTPPWTLNFLWTSDPEPRALLAEITQTDTLSTAGFFHFLSPFSGLCGMNQNGDTGENWSWKICKNQRQGIWKEREPPEDFPKSSESHLHAF